MLCLALPLVVACGAKTEKSDSDEGSRASDESSDELQQSYCKLRQAAAEESCRRRTADLLTKCMEAGECSSVNAADCAQIAPVSMCLQFLEQVLAQARDVDCDERYLRLLDCRLDGGVEYLPERVHSWRWKEDCDEAEMEACVPQSTLY